MRTKQICVGASLGTALAVLCLASCTHTRPAPPVAEAQQPMAWPYEPVLTCRARVYYARQFLSYYEQGLPEDRIIISTDWDSSQERAEILEIRRRVYHDQDALKEVTACANHQQDT